MNANIMILFFQIINQFFDKIIRIVHFWGGDIIKFSGDALTIVWPVDDEDDDDDGQRVR